MIDDQDDAFRPANGETATLANSQKQETWPELTNRPSGTHKLRDGLSENPSSEGFRPLRQSDRISRA